MVGSKIYEKDSYLRAVVGNYRESGAMAMQFKKFEFFFISPKGPFGKLFSNTVTIFKSSSEAPFLRKIGKFKIGLNPEIMQIRAFSKRSYEKTKGILYFIFTSFDTHFSKLLSSYVLSRFRIFSISYTRAKKVMHQSISAAPSSPPPRPPGYCGAFAGLFSPGGGAFANFVLPVDWCIIASRIRGIFIYI